MSDPIHIPPEAYDAFIDSLDAHQLIKLINSNRYTAKRVLEGFRPKPQSIQNPKVRQCLGNEINRDSTFLDALIDLWEQKNDFVFGFINSLRKPAIDRSLDHLCHRFGGINVYLALKKDDRLSVRRLADKCDIDFLQTKPDPTSNDSPPSVPKVDIHKQKREEKLSNDLKIHKEKVAYLTKTNRELERKLESAKNAAAKAEKEAKECRADARAKDASASKALSKAEQAKNNLQRAEQANSDLKRKIKDLRQALDERTANEQQELIKQPSVPWQDAVDQMLKAENYNSSIDFLCALIEHSNDDHLPHEYLVNAYRDSNQLDSQIKELEWLGRHYLGKGIVKLAADRLCSALALDIDSAAVNKALSEVFRRTDCKNEKRMSEIRSSLRRIRTEHPEVYDKAMLLAKEVSPELAELLEIVPAACHLDKMFTLGLNGVVRSISPSQIIQAINRNDVDTVLFVKDALEDLKENEPDDYKAIMDAILHEDATCSVPIRFVTEPVIVDASNVAHANSNGKPKLNNILAMRRTLRQNRFFPTFLLADAALPYQIDRSSELRQMVDSSEIDLVNPRTDADEIIIAKALELDCPVVTKDQMTDWDPERKVPKIQFMLGDNWAALIK